MKAIFPMRWISALEIFQIVSSISVINRPSFFRVSILSKAVDRTETIACTHRGLRLLQKGQLHSCTNILRMIWFGCFSNYISTLLYLRWDMISGWRDEAYHSLTVQSGTCQYLHMVKKLQLEGPQNDWYEYLLVQQSYEQKRLVLYTSKQPLT